MDTKRMSAAQKFEASHPFDLMEPDYPLSYTGESTGWNNPNLTDKQWRRIVEKCQASPNRWITQKTGKDRLELSMPTPHKASQIQSRYASNGLEIMLGKGEIYARVQR
jgi:hypothetical protein